MAFKMLSDEEIKKRFDKIQAREKVKAKQKRLDMFACAAMQSLLIRPLEQATDEISLAKTAYIIAEALEAERERRIRG